MLMLICSVAAKDVFLAKCLHVPESESVYCLVSSEQSSFMGLIDTAELVRHAHSDIYDLHPTQQHTSLARCRETCRMEA